MGTTRTGAGSTTTCSVTTGTTPCPSLQTRAGASYLLGTHHHHPLPRSKREQGRFLVLFSATTSTPPLPLLQTREGGIILFSATTSTPPFPCSKREREGFLIPFSATTGTTPTPSLPLAPNAREGEFLILFWVTTCTTTPLPHCKCKRGGFY
jgi:hypothetical protein